MVRRFSWRDEPLGRRVHRVRKRKKKKRKTIWKCLIDWSWCREERPSVSNGIRDVKPTATLITALCLPFSSIILLCTIYIKCAFIYSYSCFFFSGFSLLQTAALKISFRLVSFYFYVLPILWLFSPTDTIRNSEMGHIYLSIYIRRESGDAGCLNSYVQWT